MSEKQATFFERARQDRWMLAISILALGILGISAGATIFRETLLSDLAWNNQVELERGWRLLQAEVAPDGSIWVLGEQQEPYSAEIRHYEDAAQPGRV